MTMQKNCHLVQRLPKFWQVGIFCGTWENGCLTETAVSAKFLLAAIENPSPALKVITLVHL